MNPKRLLKLTSIILVVAIIGMAAVIYTADRAITSKSSPYLYESPHVIPETYTAVVLGTSRFLSNGSINPYFSYRIETAAQLYRSGKIKYIIVSGDNSRIKYNEPVEMKQSLIDHGVPAEKIYLDYAGFRTLDSVIRMEDIFSQTKFIIISQKFHNERAVYIARSRGLEAYGMNAADVEGIWGARVHTREKLARVKVFLDVLTGKKAKFSGEKIFPGKDAPNDPANW